MEVVDAALRAMTVLGKDNSSTLLEQGAVQLIIKAITDHEENALVVISGLCCFCYFALGNQVSLVDQGVDKLVIKNYEKSPTEC